MNVPSRPLTITEVISSTLKVDSWRSAPERPSLWQTAHSDSKITIPFTGGEVTAGGSGSEVGGGGSGSGSEDGGGTTGSGSEVGGGASGCEDDGGSGSEDGGGTTGSGSGSEDGGASGSEVDDGTTGSGSSGTEATGVSVGAEALVVGAWVAGAASGPSRSSGSGPGWEVPEVSAAAAATSVGAEASGAALYAVVGAEVA